MYKKIENKLTYKNYWILYIINRKIVIRILNSQVISNKF